MGYYTRYELTVDREDFPQGFEEYFLDVTGYSIESIEDAKWYSFHENMIEISQRYPNHIFRLRGYGEERGDIWQIFYSNGKTQSWSWSDECFPDFNKEELK